MEAQEALRRAALAIEQRLQAEITTSSGKTLRDIMLGAPLDGVELDRHSVYPHIRDVEI